jgi:hypothetical protein
VARVLPQAFARRQVTDYGDFTQATAEEVTQLWGDRPILVSERMLDES